MSKRHLTVALRLKQLNSWPRGTCTSGSATSLASGTRAKKARRGSYDPRRAVKNIRRHRLSGHSAALLKPMIWPRMSRMHAEQIGELSARIRANPRHGSVLFLTFAHWRFTSLARKKARRGLG